MQSSFTTYLFTLGFIFSWWWIAFSPSNHSYSEFQGLHQIQREPLLAYNQLQLAPLEREILHQALTGDFNLMTRLIADWDVEAQILEAEGLVGIKRLQQEAFILSQKIGRTLTQRKEKSSTYLPQSYLAASYLLALLEPGQITAIPEGLRRQKFLYPEAITSRVTLNLDQACAEKLYLYKPQKAFIAQYSHPSIVTMLQKQGIEICKINTLNSFNELTDALKYIGQSVGQQEKAELLALFMEASLHAIDNRLLVIAKQCDITRQGICYLNYDMHFSAPTSMMVIGQLLKRLNINTHLNESMTLKEKQEHWKISFEQEELMRLNPPFLIISSSHPTTYIQERLTNNRALAELEAVKNHRVYWVNEEIMETTSQYIVLAYYDLYVTLAHAHHSG